MMTKDFTPEICMVAYIECLTEYHNNVISFAHHYKINVEDADEILEEGRTYMEELAMAA